MCIATLSKDADEWVECRRLNSKADLHLMNATPSSTPITIMLESFKDAAKVFE